jgi:hypothetical protein
MSAPLQHWCSQNDKEQRFYIGTCFDHGLDRRVSGLSRASVGVKLHPVPPPRYAGYDLRQAIRYVSSSYPKLPLI